MIRLAPNEERGLALGFWNRSVTAVGPGVGCIPLALVNAYLVGEPGAADGSWALVDAGISLSAGRIVAAAQDWFGPNSRPGAIILTHGHFDHVGGLPALLERWDAPVYAHPLEFPYLTGQSAYPPPDPAVGGGAMSLLSRFYSRGPFDFSDRLRPLPEDGTVPSMPGWRWIHTPGHAPGHVSLFRDEDRVLLAGDAFVTQKQESAWGVLTHGPWAVQRPPAYFTIDWEAARQSVEALAWLKPELAATGHGLPMRGLELRRQLQGLILSWNEVAVPDDGRYVRRPAVTGPEGVIDVPGPVFDGQLATLAGVSLAVVLGVMLWKSMMGSGRREAL